MEIFCILTVMHLLKPIELHVEKTEFYSMWILPQYFLNQENLAHESCNFASIYAEKNSMYNLMQNAQRQNVHYFSSIFLFFNML